jgi:hypothetical protein
MRQTFVFAVAGILSLLMSNSVLAQQAKEKAKTAGSSGSVEDQHKKTDLNRAQHAKSLQGTSCRESQLPGPRIRVEWMGSGRNKSTFPVQPRVYHFPSSSASPEMGIWIS